MISRVGTAALLCLALIGLGACRGTSSSEVKDDAVTPTATATSTTCDGDAKPLAGSCWYKGALGASCTQTCSALGKVYDEATKTFGGSDGTDANCTVLGNLFGIQQFHGAFDCNNSGASGCMIRDTGLNTPLATWRCTSPTLADRNPYSGASRICACASPE